MAALYMGANVAKIESANFDRPLTGLLDRIDFETSADNWLARFSAYRRRERQADLQKPAVRAIPIKLR
jgi:hypothetical protein